jgi:hypothetical protein
VSSHPLGVQSNRPATWVEKRNLNLYGSLFINGNTFEVLKSRFEPIADDEERIELG